MTIRNWSLHGEFQAEDAALAQRSEASAVPPPGLVERETSHARPVSRVELHGPRVTELLAGLSRARRVQRMRRTVLRFADVARDGMAASGHRVDLVMVTLTYRPRGGMAASARLHVRSTRVRVVGAPRSHLRVRLGVGNARATQVSALPRVVLATARREASETGLLCWQAAYGAVAVWADPRRAGALAGLYREVHV